ncbi:MAG TPA: hypothetical protein VGI45_21755 [Terracidiphilus sp.]
MAVTTNARIVIRPMTAKRPLLSKWADVFCAVLGIGTSFSGHLVGDLYAAEALLLVVFPVLIILRGRRVLRGELKVFYLLMAFWLLGLVIADGYNQIPIVDRMRGVALIVFFGINVLGMSILLGQNEKRKVYYFVGLMLGALAAVRLQPSLAFQDYPWKFGYSWGTMQLVLIVSSYLYARHRYVVSALLILGICAVNLALNYRSPVLDLLLTIAMVYPIIPERFGNFQLLPKTQGLRLVVLALIATVAAGAAKQMVDFVTKAGLISDEAKEKNESQAKLGNLLLGGRPEFVIGLRAALDSPLIGHGSWAKDIKYFEMFYDWTVETGAQEEQTGGDIEAEADGLIPGHSHIITAWVWAGIAGLIFWIYVISLVGRGMASVALLRPPLAPLYMWFLISMFWDILFSPFAANRRVTEAVMVVIVADLLEKRVPVIQASWRRMGATVNVRALKASNKPIISSS